MSILQPQLTMPGSRRTTEPMQIANTARGGAANQTTWCLLGAATANTPTYQWTIPGDTPALLWDTTTQTATTSTALDLTAHAYVIFCLENGAQLYAVPQELWSAVAPVGVNVCPIAWVDAQVDLTPRLLTAPPSAGALVWLNVVQNSSALNNYLVPFTTAGVWTGVTITGNGLTNPQGMANVGTQVWVANNATSTISRFNRDGSVAAGELVLPSYYLSAAPYDIVVVGSVVWISDSNNNWILRYNLDGTPFSGGPIFDPVTYWPSAMCVVGNTVWVNDFGTLQIAVLAFDGTTIASSFTAPTNTLSEMTLVGSTTVWGTDPFDNQIYLFDVATGALSFLGATSLNQPEGIGVVTRGATSEVWVANGLVSPSTPGVATITRFRPDGTILLPSYSMPWGGQSIMQIA